MTEKHQPQRILVIDRKRCIRCGNCERTCRKRHRDGISRCHHEGPSFGRWLFPAICHDCVEKACRTSCPILRQHPEIEDPFGPECLGCGACLRSCALLRLVPLGDVQNRESEVRRLPQKKEPARRAVCCDRCADFLQPGCVYGCPTGALREVSPKELLPLVKNQRQAVENYLSQRPQPPKKTKSPPTKKTSPSSPPPNKNSSPRFPPP